MKWINLADAFDLMKDIRLSIFFFTIFLLFLVHLTKALRTYLFMKSLNFKLNFHKNFIVHMIVPIIGRFTPGQIGEGAKIFFLGKNKEITFTFILEKVIDIIILMVISLFAIINFKFFVKSYLIFILLAIIGVIALLNIEKILNLILRRKVFEKKWFKIYLRKSSPKNLALFLFFSLIVRLLLLIFPYFIALSMNIKISLLMIIQAYSLAMLVGIVSGLPGGLGSKEFTLTFLLINFAYLNKDIAGIYTLFITFSLILGESLFASISYLIYKLNLFTDKDSPQTD
jgi:uncharacterized membrane protein YbhN (UPF0104 family)